MIDFPCINITSTQARSSYCLCKFSTSRYSQTRINDIVNGNSAFVLFEISQSSECKLKDTFRTQVLAELDRVANEIYLFFSN